MVTTKEGYKIYNKNSLKINYLIIPSKSTNNPQSSYSSLNSPIQNTKRLN